MVDTTLDPTEASAAELAERIRRGELSVVEIAEAHLDRIEEQDDGINAFVTVTADLALEAAEAADRAVEDRSTDDLGPLHGVPVALKDLRDMKEGVRHTYGSALIDEVGFVASRTTVAVERLEAAGAVILGKTNVPEFGHKGTTQNDLIGATASPVDPSLNAGGSSGGAAAAVAAGMAPVALGSDAGGSIRIPAAFCGVVGVKPSFGLVPVDSRPNAFDKTTHHVAKAPLARSVEDAALAMDAIAGPHPADPDSVPVEIDFRGAVERGVEDLQVAYSSNLDVFPVEDSVSKVVDGAVGALGDAGAVVEEVEVGHGRAIEELKDAVLTTFSTGLLGVRATLRETFGVDLLEHRERVSDSLIELLEIGLDRDVEDVAATGPVRTDVYDAVESTFAEYDVLMTPTLGTSGMALRSDAGHKDWELALTWPFNWTGHPAVSAPGGLTDDGGPVGVQIVGRRYEDDTVFAASAAMERELGHDLPLGN